MLVCIQRNRARPPFQTVLRGWTSMAWSTPFPLSHPRPAVSQPPSPLTCGRHLQTTPIQPLRGKNFSDLIPIQNLTICPEIITFAYHTNLWHSKQHFAEKYFMTFRIKNVIKLNTIMYVIIMCNFSMFLGGHVKLLRKDNISTSRNFFT